MKNIINKTVAIAAVALTFASCNSPKSINLADYGLIPNTGENSAPLFKTAIEKLPTDAPLVVTLPQGRYDIYPDGSFEREYYISNHDQDNPKKVGLAFEKLKNVTFDGQGSELIFHGRMLPVSLLNSENCTLKNFSIDFENPHISQIKILENDTVNNIITFEVAPWVEYEIRDSVFVAKGVDWEHTPSWGIAFEEKTKRLVYNTSDIGLGVKQVEEISPRVIKSNKWRNKKLIPGTVVAMRSYRRPTPGIFLSHDKNTTIQNVKVHYAEGMGLLAQMSENITLDGFQIPLRGESDPRYFTTQADATHFSGCKGKITSINGLYEGMMDDAINVHGTYLKVQQRVDDKTLICEYMHSQSYGFDWGYAGDSVQFVESRAMELVGEKNRIASIESLDKPMKKFRITFENLVDTTIHEGGAFGIENLEWTPEVYFADNVIRNNRARGSLFSTPKKTVVERNIFDHTSGTAILLCGDCNGWYETGACKDVVIRNNKFISSLTNMFQFTNATISIYPEIPELGKQQKYFHRGIVIEDNDFEMFDTPILYAKSVDGLVFRNNRIRNNQSYPAFHWNKHKFLLERVVNYDVAQNDFEGGFDEQRDLKSLD